MRIFFLFHCILFLSSLSFSQWSNNPNTPLIVGYGQDPKMCSDGAGGCYLTYTYETTWYPQKLAIERIDKYGYKPWGTKKQILGELPEQWQPQITEDLTGGTFICYLDDSSVYKYVVKVQRVDSMGNFLWPPTGVKVSLTQLNHGGQKIVNDNDDGAVVTWLDTENNYYINRINSAGQRVWGDSGKFLMHYLYGVEPQLIKGEQSYYFFIRDHIIKINTEGDIERHDSLNYYIKTLCPDGNDGIITLEVSNEFYPNNIQLMGRRFDAAGNNLWSPCLVLAESLYTYNWPLIVRNKNYFFYLWLGKKNGINRVGQIQALRLDGSKLFNESISIGASGIIPSDSMKILVVYNDDNDLESTYIQCFDTLGNKLFIDSLMIINEGLGYQNIITDHNGGLIISGAMNQFTIVAQQVSGNGLLGVVPVELISFSTEILDNTVLLKWQTASESNNKGFEIQRTSPKPYKGAGKWEVIGFIGGAGSITEPKHYSFIDRPEKGIIKYRLKQVDYDGSFAYSKEIEVNLGLPTEFTLYQNYPNPFNPNTTIQFSLPHEENVRLSLLNILGEEVKELINEKFSAGSHKYTLSASSLTSGIYIYRIKAGSFTDMKKLIVMR